MNWVDLVIVGAVAIPAFIGFRNGIIKTVFTLGGLIVGLVIARLYTEDVAAILATFLESETAQTVVAFAAIVIAAVVAATVAARVVKLVLSVILLGWVDNVIGAVIGGVVGGSIATGIVLVMRAVGASAVDQSALAPVFDSLLGPVLEIVLGNLESLTGFPLPAPGV